MMKIGLKRSGPGIGKLYSGLKALKSARALVGIPQADTARKDGKINNAEALFLFSKGSPLRGIQPREVIEPAINAEGNKEPIARKLAAASTAALNGDREGMLKNLDLAGQIGESASKRWFTDPRNGWAPNKASTVRRKLRKVRGAKRKLISDTIEEAFSSGDPVDMDAVLSQFDTPGIDTGQMRRALTHVTDPGDGSASYETL